jgi:hypothetical protein
MRQLRVLRIRAGQSRQDCIVGAGGENLEKTPYLDKETRHVMCRVWSKICYLSAHCPIMQQVDAL